MTTIAYFATYRHYYGMAMRTQDNEVWFRQESTGQWRQLFDSDIPDLQLHGRVDLAQAAAIQDGDLVLKASRTLQARRAA